MSASASTGASSQLYITILNYTLLEIVVKVSQAAHTNCAVRCCVLANLSWQPTTHLTTTLDLEL